MTTPESEIERTFAIFEADAINGRRATANQSNGGDANPDAVRILYERGRMLGKIYGTNFRVVMILTGPNAGKQTALPPPHMKLWKVIDRNGTKMFLNGRAA